MVAAMLLGLAFTACEKEDTTSGNNGGGNNNGTAITDDDTGIELNMLNDGSDEIYFEVNYIDYDGFVRSTRIYIAMSTSNNFFLRQTNSAALEYDISRVGSVAGMPAITNIPTSGWVKQIAVNPGTGYVIRYKGQGFGYTYARLYVKDWIVGTGGGIIGATVVYQDKWGQTGNNNNALFGTSWSTTGVQTTENGITHTLSDILEFSSSDFTGTMQTIDDSPEGYYTDSYSFTYTYENNHGEMTLIIPGMSSSELPVFSFVVEGNVLTLTITDPVTGEASPAGQFYRQ